MYLYSLSFSAQGLKEIQSETDRKSVQPPGSHSYFWWLFLWRLCLWVLLWHSTRHLFPEGLLSAVVDVECGRAATIDFSCLGFSFLTLVLFPENYFNLGWAGCSCFGAEVWAACGTAASGAVCVEPRELGTARAMLPINQDYPGGICFPPLLQSVQTDPKSPVPPVLRVSEKLGAYSLQRKKVLFLPHWLPGVVFSWPNEDK